MTQPKLIKTKLVNVTHYRDFQLSGCDYILNPITNELHRISLNNLFGSHNLEDANLHNFIGLKNIDGNAPLHSFPRGTTFSIYDSETNEFKENYVLDKCSYCFP